MALHTLQNPDRWNDCVATLTASDTLLLIDRAVYLSQSASIKALPCPGYVLKADLELAGLAIVSSSGKNADGWLVADYSDWVKLTEVHAQHVAWS